MVTDGTDITVDTFAGLDRLVGASVYSLAYVDSACVSIVTHVFIDNSVAVVVNSIAAFRHRGRCVAVIKTRFGTHAIARAAS